jgi:hypothetical protein
MEAQTFLGWVELPEAQPVRFGDLPGLLAGALHTDELAQSAAEINFTADLQKMVVAGELMVRDPLTLGRHSFPHGAALRRAVLLPNEDLRPLLASRSIGLRLIPNGIGPTHWTIANAASAIATQEGWHQGARDTLREQMLQAATDGTLTIRHPHTGMTYRPDRVRDFYDLVTPADVNAWLACDSEHSMVWSQSVSVPPHAEDSSKATAEFPTKVSQAAERCDALSEPPAGPAGATKPVQRWAAQESEILRVLRELQFKPSALTKPEAGKPGPKAAARKALGSAGMWAGDKVFDKAWERLRKAGDIADNRLSPESGYRGTLARG